MESKAEGAECRIDGCWSGAAQAVEARVKLRRESSEVVASRPKMVRSSSGGCHDSVLSAAVERLVCRTASRCRLPAGKTKRRS